MEGVSLRENLEQVRERIARAAERSGRQASDITLIAVTKKFPASVIRDAFDLGLREFGENYVQEFEGKFPLLQDLLPQARFQLIGHLQSNKARKASELFRVIQTVDSVKLAQRLDGMGVPMDTMIEVKLSGEESKEGAAPDEIPAIAEALRGSRNLRLTGLMTMPPWSEDPEQTRPYFRQLATLARRENLPHLSMGMSHDLEAAIEEGATHVRVGTALFGRRRKD
ncbi:MAG: YggS family pyridoxal phosphate-dependent enzyme [Acidobacteria bacterium]|nr:YggS family pyridoxal phosphate-dependent enzyme [Acidobacteriota bacterium]